MRSKAVEHGVQVGHDECYLPVIPPDGYHAIGLGTNKSGCDVAAGDQGF
ncbi:MAG TPA: hypothetical protein VH107_16810 [Lacipirellulaceae bacterium]|nr:hypothetical protein [Lacipirellulaceae bacterium]